jgi:hypothetical protein
MRLVLEIPSAWQQSRVGDQHVVVLPGSSGQADLGFAYGPAVGYPINDAGWIDSTLRAGAGSAKLEIEQPRNEQASAGWPFKLVRAVVYVDNKPVEYRLGAFFRFLEWGAAVIVRSATAARLDEHQTQIVEVLRTASLDTSDRVYCIHDLFEGLSNPTPSGGK